MLSKNFVLTLAAPVAVFFAGCSEDDGSGGGSGRCECHYSASIELPDGKIKIINQNVLSTRGGYCGWDSSGESSSINQELVCAQEGSGIPEFDDSVGFPPCDTEAGNTLCCDTINDPECYEAGRVE